MNNEQRSVLAALRGGAKVATWRPTLDPGYGEDLFDLVALVGEDHDLPTSVDGVLRAAVLKAEALAEAMGYVLLERPRALQDLTGFACWVSE